MRASSHVSKNALQKPDRLSLAAVEDGGSRGPTLPISYASKGLDRETLGSGFGKKEGAFSSVREGL